MNTQNSKTIQKKRLLQAYFSPLLCLCANPDPFKTPGLFSSSCTSANASKAFGSSRNLPRCVVVEATPSSRSQCLSGFLSLGCPFSIFEMHMDVSKNRGTSKSSILIGFSLINHPFWGTPIFGNIHIRPVHCTSVFFSDTVLSCSVLPARCPDICFTGLRYMEHIYRIYLTCTWSTTRGWLSGMATPARDPWNSWW